MPLMPVSLDELRKIEPTEPPLEACETCWTEHNARHGQGPDDDDWFPFAWENDGVPQYNPNCLLCVAHREIRLAEFKARHDRWQARHGQTGELTSPFHFPC